MTIALTILQVLAVATAIAAAVIWIAEEIRNRWPDQ